MNSMPTVDLDPIRALTWFTSLFLSPVAASYAAPYAIILLASLCGSTWALQKKGVTGRYSSFWFVTWASVLSLLLTVPLSTALASRIDNWEAQWFFAPMAFLIGYKCDRVETLIAFGWQMFKTWVSLAVNKKGDSQ